MLRGRPLVLLILVIPVLATAQAPRRATPPAVAPPGARLILEGKYDEAIATADLMTAGDPAAALLKGRALIARGRYAEADTVLRPVAVRLPTGEVALELGLLYQTLGRQEATPIFVAVASLASTSVDAGELARAGRALRALGRFQQANAAYRNAASLAPNDVVVNTGWGELFLEKYNRADALQSFEAALKTDQHYTPALIGKARTLLDESPPQAIAAANQALSVNPLSVDAQLVIVNAALDMSKQDEARKALDKALAINPASLDAMALVAALEYVQDKLPAFEAQVDKVLAIAPTFGEIFRVAGAVAARNYRFDEAAALTRRALAIDPDNPHSLADLGTHLLRTGDEDGARKALDASFKFDPFDVVTFNLLNMLDTLDKFETVRDGNLIVRMSKDEAPVLKEYAIPLAHQALKELAARYEFSPRGDVLIEIFPKHDDFAVRNVGLPGMVGALGACFGRVVTMDSPKARPPGDFQWEATLWHELAHVITVQMSNQRVPRWLTEGISVYEEKRARPEWARPMDVQFAGMLNRGETLKLRDLNAAFTDPKKVSLAYFQGELVVDYMATTFGDAGLRKLLRTFGQGLDTDQALKAALNTSFDDMQAGFDAAMQAKFGAIRRALVAPPDVDLGKASAADLKTAAASNPGSFPVFIALGRALLQAGSLDEAIRSFEKAASLIPMPAGKDSPHALIADIALQKKDPQRAVVALEALLTVDFDNVVAARRLAGLLRETRVEDSVRLRRVYERIIAIDPYDVEAHAALGRMAMQRNEADAASREFRSVLALGVVDRAAALADLAESYLKAGKTADAKKQTLAALEVAPAYERAQDLLLKLTERR